MFGMRCYLQLLAVGPFGKDHLLPWLSMLLLFLVWGATHSFFFLGRERNFNVSTAALLGCSQLWPPRVVPPAGAPSREEAVSILHARLAGIACCSIPPAPCYPPLPPVASCCESLVRKRWPACKSATPDCIRGPSPPLQDSLCWSCAHLHCPGVVTCMFPGNISAIRLDSIRVANSILEMPH